MNLSWVAASLLFIACGEVKGTNNGPDAGSNVDPNADFTLSVDPTSLTIPIAGSATVTVTVERTGETGDIALSATGLGTNLEAEFSPAAIPEGETSSEVTITVKGGTTAGSSTVTLTGTAGDKTHSADVSVTTTTITVTGIVRGNRAGVKVGIIGKQSVTSGAGGVFTFTDVTPPYDLYTFTNGGCGNSPLPTVYYFDDLTRADPTVSAAVYFTNCIFIPPILCTAPAPNSSVSGMKSGTGNNTDFVLWAWSEGSFSSPTLNTNGSFSGTASWCSGNTSSGSLEALQFTKKGNGAPDTFLGYAKTTLSLTNGSPRTNVGLVFTAVNSTGTIQGTLNGPSGLPTPSVELVQQFSGRSRQLWTANTTAIDAAFPIIASAGGTTLYASSSMSGVGSSYFVHPLTATATLDFTMPAPALLMMPADAATGVTTQTMFEWTASPGVISQVYMSGTGAAFYIYTTSNSTTIPVVPELALPAATSFSWSITSFAPAASTNDAAGTDALRTAGYEFTGALHAHSNSVSRSFTTQ